MDYREAVNRIMGLVDYERPSTIPGQQPRYDLNRIGAFLELLGNPPPGNPDGSRCRDQGQGQHVRYGVIDPDRRGLQPGHVLVATYAHLSGEDSC